MVEAALSPRRLLNRLAAAGLAVTSSRPTQRSRRTVERRPTAGAGVKVAIFRRSELSEEFRPTAHRTLTEAKLSTSVGPSPAPPAYSA